jgi:hypothetical protein
VAAGLDRREPNAVLVKARVADRVDASVLSVKTAGPDASLDALVAEPRREELVDRDHRVLVGRDLSDQGIGPAVGAFWVHITHKAPSDGDFALRSAKSTSLPSHPARPGLRSRSSGTPLVARGHDARGRSYA